MNKTEKALSTLMLGKTVNLNAVVYCQLSTSCACAHNHRCCGMFVTFFCQSISQTDSDLVGILVSHVATKDQDEEDDCRV